MKKDIPWHKYTSKEVARRFSVDLLEGLPQEEVKKRLAQYGKNIFEDSVNHYVLRLIVRQFKNPLALILFAAGIATLFLGEYLDTIVIFLALLINISVGMFQEGRTSRAFGKLKESQQKSAFVLRDGKKAKISAGELVVGDIIFLEAGNAVPADCRLVSSTGLFVNESALTGEWVDVLKDPHVAPQKSKTFTEQQNMAWMGTFITAGSGKAIVTATGERTQIGLVAVSLRDARKEHTPLQNNLRKLAYFLSAVIVLIIVFLIVVGFLRGGAVGQLLLVAVAVAVAAIPAGLPAAVTVVLALGMETILKKNGLVRNLLAAETLGSTTIILTDKTGTLTEAKMKVASVLCLASVHEGNGETHKEFQFAESGDEKMALTQAVLVSDAFVEQRKNHKDAFIVRGRPIERAIVSAGLENGMYQESLLQEYPRVDFLPFESKHRFAASLHKHGKAKLNRLIVVGAPEVIINTATSFLEGGHVHHVSEHTRKKLFSFQEEESKKGARMVAVAYKDIAKDVISEEVGTRRAEPLGGAGKTVSLHNITFSGFILLKDPIRSGVRESIAAARRAGVRVIMLTGDYQETAHAVAEDVGITQKGIPTLVGSDVEELTDKELYKKLKTVNVFARVMPAQKLRIARILKSKGEVVAMTGDGINDAPALRSADIGIALGSGTDVAKEASDLVLLDDGFNIIVHAIEEGRRVVDNLKKIVAYLLSTGFSEIFVIGSALIMAAPLPLLPAQILWINIVEEGFMNFAFAFEPKEKDIMNRDPRVSKGIVLTPNLIKLILIIALVTGFFLVALYFILLSLSIPIEEIRTMMFIALAVDSLFFSFSIKNLHKPIWRINIFSNRYLVFALVSSLLMLLIALLLPPLQTLLSLTPLSGTTLIFFIGLGVLNLLFVEGAKYLVFKKEAQKRTMNI
tara:strand:- start:18263 stop:20998 length:2736 start_codon:yes stop_codon:yes gene_type:complete